ncbi:hypothetical protein [Candidatus Tisiphia endosymbiont of Beris chalybata]
MVYEGQLQEERGGSKSSSAAYYKSIQMVLLLGAMVEPIDNREAI